MKKCRIKVKIKDIQLDRGMLTIAIFLLFHMYNISNFTPRKDKSKDMFANFQFIFIPDFVLIT